MVGALCLVVSLSLASCGVGSQGKTSYPASSIPRYNHIFLVVMENHDYEDMIGSRQLPHINALAKQYGLATNYWAVTHPSEPNYVAMIGGSFFGIIDDNSYAVNTLTAANLGSQLEAARLTWKSYQQGMPTPGYTGTMAYSTGNVYASKHNPFLNFLNHYPVNQRGAELNNNVPGSQLATDLASGAAPNFAFISPGLCYDMHGDPACGSANLLSNADNFAYQTVNQITSSSLWSQGNNAIVITWDESDPGVALGPSGITSVGGHVATIVITSHGPRGVKDNTPYNHYSLLLTIQDAFGLGCLLNSCPVVGGVQPMAPLFGAQAG